MKIRELQRFALERLLIEDKLEKGIELPRTIIKAVINNQTLAKQYGRPLLPRYEFTQLENKDYVDLHNKNVEAINTDSDILADALANINKQIGSIERMSRNLRTLIPQLSRKVAAEVERVSKNMNLFAQSIIENFNSTTYIDLENTTATVDTDAGICRSFEKRNNSIRMSDINFDNVGFRLNTGQTYSIRGEIERVFRPENIVPLTIEIYSDDLDGVTGTLVIPINNKEINMLDVAFNSPDNLRISATLILDDGSTIRVLEDVVASNSFHRTFDVYTVQEIDIEFTIDQPIEPYSNGYLYELQLLNVSFDRSQIRTESWVYSREYELSLPITEAILRAHTYEPGNTRIDFDISSDRTNWIPIKVSTDEEEHITTLTDKAPHLITGITDSISKQWSEIEGDATFGNNVLYNILDYVDEGVDEGALDIATGSQLVPTSVKLKRGFDTYAIQTAQINIPADVESVEHTLIYDEDSETYSKTIPLRVHRSQVAKKVRKEKLAGGSFEYYIYLQNTPIYGTVEVDDGSTALTTVIPEPGAVPNHNYKKVRIASGVVDGSTVYVSYDVYLDTLETEEGYIIEVDSDSVRVFTTPKQDSNFELSTNDFDYLDVDKKLLIYPNARITPSINDEYTIYISYTYYMRSREEVHFYETHILLKEQKSLTIFPFTTEEIGLGNFHLIDGEVHSQDINITLDAGWHTIQTTQPYKNDPNNDDDVNEITGKQSEAGILLRDSGDVPYYSQMIAFNQYLRQVDTFKLANVISPNDHRSFAVKDNKVYINFKPDTIPPSLVQTDFKGKDILVKRAIYTVGGENDYQFDRYEGVSDTFELSYEVIPENEIKSIWFRAKMTREPDYTGESPNIDRVDIVLR